MEDGGEIALDWASDPRHRTNKQIVMLFPGISGDSTNYYCVSVKRDCEAYDFDFVVVNWRGMGGVELKSANGYNGVDFSHIQEAVDYVHSQYCCEDNGRQTRRLSGIGISMGAGVLALYAGKTGEACKLDSCVGIGCHYQFKEAMEEIKTNTFGIYDKIIAQGFLVWGIEYYK